MEGFSGIVLVSWRGIRIGEDFENGL